MYTDRSTAISSLFLVLPVHVAGDGLRKGKEPRGGNSDGREGSWSLDIRKEPKREGQRR